MVIQQSRTMTWLASALLALSVGDVTAAVAIQYEGTAQLAEGNAFAYREMHYLERNDDGAGERLVLYLCKDGQAFARKTVSYGAGSLAPDFALEDARNGYREGVRTVGGKRSVFVKYGAKRERSAPLPDVDGLVADAAIDDFVTQHVDRLVAGESVRIPMLVPGERDFMVFKVKREGATQIDGESALVFRLTLGAWYGRFLPHIDVTYTSDDRALRRYEGLSNLRDLKLDNLVVAIDFPPAARAPLDRAARDAARTVALARSCT